MKFFSLRNRLMAGVVISLMFGWIAAAFLFIVTIIDDTEEYIREDVSLHASNIADSLSLDGLGPSLEHLDQWRDRVIKSQPDIIGSRLQNEENFAVQIWYKDTLLARTETGPVLPPPQLEDQLTAPYRPNYSEKNGLSQSPYSDIDDPNNLPEWWVYSARVNNGDLWIYTAQLNDIAAIFWLDMAGDAIIIGLLAIPFLSAFVHYLMGILLRPIDKVTGTVDAWRARHFTPIDTRKLPSELALLAEYLNGLLITLQSGMQQLDTALESEKRFTANAAHELLTPLAAIRSEAQLLQRQSQDHGFTDGLRDIIIRVDRATHTVEQLVTLARLDPEGLKDGSTSFNIVEKLLDTLASLGDKIEQKNHHLDVNIPDMPLMMDGNPSGLEILLRNLVDNAIRYTDHKGTIAITLDGDGRHLRLSLANSGRNLPDYLKAQIFERFVRGAGNSESGSGLGLSIVKRIVELHDGTVSIKDPDTMSGFEIVITFPQK